MHISHRKTLKKLKCLHSNTITSTTSWRNKLLIEINIRVSSLFYPYHIQTIYDFVTILGLNMPSPYMLFRIHCEAQNIVRDPY